MNKYKHFDKIVLEGVNMKKGFTLIELLAVLVILGLLVGISYPVINRTIFKYRNDLLIREEENIVLAARMWGSDNSELLPNSSNDTVISFDEMKTRSNIDYGIIKITYGNLISEGYIDRGTNPVTKEDILDDDYYILIKKNNKKWDYELHKNE